jgi:hypothetical protein
MKKLALLAAIILLNACSSAEPAPETAGLPLPEETAAAAPATDAKLSTDPFLADQATAAPTAPATGPSAAASESQSADSLLATPVPSDSGTVKMNPVPKAEALASPTPSTPPASAAESLPTPRLSQNHEVPATPVMPPAKSDPRKFNTYEAYKEYEKKEASRQELQDSYDDRALFPHEDGGWQIGLDYTRNAFSTLDFDPSVVTKNFDTQGGGLSVGYFPLRSLSFGRLGLSVNYAVFWTKYLFNTTPTSVNASKVHSIDSYGAKAVYEFDYFLGQLFVPWVYYGMDKVTVRAYNLSTTSSAGATTVYANYPKSTFNRQIYGGGMHLNLNRLEPTSASRGLANLGIRKTYLTYTYLAASNGGTGASHYLGLRFEY